MRQSREAVKRCAAPGLQRRKAAKFLDYSTTIRASG
jgi:hypothetical protein